MSKVTAILMVLFFSLSALMARVIVVDPNGDITSIQAGINVAAPGDTVKILPGTYEEQVVLNKDILVMGSGYENTLIVGYYDPLVEVKSGVLQWVRVTSYSGHGIRMGGGTIRNLVVRDCAKSGIIGGGGDSYIENCVIYRNTDFGIYSNNGNLYVTNTISWANNNRGYYTNGGGGIYLNYSIGSWGYWGGFVNGVENVDADPQFTSNEDFHIGSGSPGWDSGHPSQTDPDGSRSDRGYFGGPHAPIYPVVTKIQIVPLDNGGVRIEATGRANW